MAVAPSFAHGHEMGLRLRFLNVAGQILNLAGLPGWVRTGRYDSVSAAVRVRTSGLYTVVTVNDVDVYFYRLTGRIDGVGVSGMAQCGADAASAADHDWRHRPASLAWPATASRKSTSD